VSCELSEDAVEILNCGFVLPFDMLIILYLSRDFVRNL